MKVLCDFITRQLHRGLITIRESETLEFFVGVQEKNRLYNFSYDGKIDVNYPGSDCTQPIADFAVSSNLIYCGSLEFKNEVSKLWWFGFGFEFESSHNFHKQNIFTKSSDSKTIEPIVKVLIVECEKLSKQLSRYET